MFGREYANNINIITQSFEQMNDEYKFSLQNQKTNSLIEILKKFYIMLFGIPEIGFQVRSLYFKKILSSHYLRIYPKKILDAGSGIGSYTFWLGKTFKHAQVIGGEIDKSKLRTSKTMRDAFKLDNVSFMAFDITKKQSKQQYDLIVVIDVLEHIKDYKIALKNFYKLLNNGGYLYIHVPQPNQKRIFKALKSWHHEDHAREGVKKNILENTLKKTGFTVITSQETFGFFGKLAWEINHLLLSKSFVFAGVTFPFLYLLAIADNCVKNKDGLGIAILAKKK